MPYLMIKYFNDTLTNDSINFERKGPEPKKKDWMVLTGLPHLTWVLINFDDSN